MRVAPGHAHRCLMTGAGWGAVPLMVLSCAALSLFASSAGAADCNGNGLDDEQEVAAGTSPDCNNTGLPDECELDPLKLTALVTQPPDHAGGVFADVNCASCASIDQQSAAANFSIGVPTVVTAVNLWGGYFPENDSGGDDDFNVILHADRRGLPGEPLGIQTELVAARRPTGALLLESTDEWLYQLTLNEPLVLAPGTYHLEIFNRTADTSDTFVWESASLASSGGVPGSAFADQAPGRSWSPAPTSELAFELIGGSPGDCNANSIPDACDLAGKTSTDCNTNRVPDECEPDCDDNGVPDDCEICSGAADCNENGIPDDCEPDADGDGVIDDCAPPDEDRDGVPDNDDRCPNTEGKASVDEEGCPLQASTGEGACGDGLLGIALVLMVCAIALVRSRTRRAYGA